MAALGAVEWNSLDMAEIKEKNQNFSYFLARLETCSWA
jgi:hypothetical protein